MGLLSHLCGLALRPVAGGALRLVGGDALGEGGDRLIGFLTNHFSDQSQLLGKALGRASERAWRSLEIALAGDSLLERGKRVLVPADEQAFRAQVQAFLSSCPLPGLDSGFRSRCLEELRAARKAGLLASASVDPEALARRAASFASFSDPQKSLEAGLHALGQVGNDLRQAGHPNLAQFVELLPPGGEPLLLLALRYFFRRAIEEDEKLARGLQWARWETLSAEQQRGFAGVADAITTQGQRLETMLDEVHEVVVRTHAVVVDLHDELKGQRQQIQELDRNVRALVEQYRRETAGTRPIDSLGCASDEERAQIRALVKRFKGLPVESRRQLPDLLASLGELQDFAGLMEPLMVPFPVGEKRLLPGHTQKPSVDARLCLRLRTGSLVRNVCLVAKRLVRLGRGRDADIQLRVLPDTPENEARTERISREHAQVEWTSQGAIWRNRECRSGTVVGGQLLDRGKATTLRQGLIVSPAGVLPLCCLLVTGPGPGRDEGYRRFEQHLGGGGNAEVEAGHHAVRFVRQDGAAGREEYLLFDRGVSIGSAGTCAIPLVHPSVGPVHAHVLWLAGGFWLEAAPDRMVKVDGTELPANHLVPLTPGVTVKVGEVEVVVTGWEQLGIDVEARA